MATGCVPTALSFAGRGRAGDMTFNWVGRTRLYGDQVGSAFDLPIGEESEQISKWRNHAKRRVNARHRR